MKHLVYLLFIFPFLLSAQLKKRVLFIGNSYTYVNNLPQLVKDIALSKSDTLVFDGYLIGGYTFQNHYNDPQVYTKIKSNVWDIVVIQGQSQEPSFSPSQVMNNSYPYAKNITDSIRAVNPCTEVMFYMTWGRKNGDASNCGVYPPVCTFNGMNARLRESYLMFADSMNASCAPVGVAWKTFRNQYPAVNLYQPDESHPSAEGSYLAAAVFYSSIFKKTAVGATYYFSLNASTAQNMLQVGGSTVMDSVAVWNLNSHIPTAAFTYSVVSGNTYQFNNTSVNASAYVWSFGSGQHSPQHTFSGTPPFTVMLAASNSCTGTAVSQTISITGTVKPDACQDRIRYLSQDNRVVVEVCNSEHTEIRIYDLSGRKVKEYHSVQESIEPELPAPGIYFLHVMHNGRVQNFKIIKP